MDGKMEDFILVEDVTEVKDNIRQFNNDISSDDELRRRFLSRYRQWYYIAELDMFAPSKFIGYKNMNAYRYNNKDGNGADGRVTEAVLKQWFEKVEIPELLDKLHYRMRRYGNIKKTSEIHILKSELPFIENSIKRELKKTREKVPAIRILPMSESDPEFTGKQIEDVQNWFLNELPFRGYNFKKGMKAEPGTLVLFQFKGHIIASAILDEKLLYKREMKGEYKGAYIFDPTSIAIFDPITSLEMQSIWKNFKGFNQSLQELDGSYYKNLYEILLRKNSRSVYDNDNLDEETFQKEVEMISIDYIEKVDDKPREKLNHIYFLSQKLKRNPLYSKRAIESAKYRCELDSIHELFISSRTGKNYVEAHHLIPMEYQDLFKKSIDVEANIISFCPLCHKKIHHAIFEEIKPMLEKMYLSRMDRLNQSGIDIKLQELFSYYS
ncbi:HNH endonuclease [Peribacillus sp. NPDC097197]|uniref:HNH endonuclease n=1 Tax=Peribacillus sp. NPDC097197 TaxID=3390615 RepID=UPI003CFF0B3B